MMRKYIKNADKKVIDKKELLIKLSSQIGIRSVEGLDEAMFLAVTKHKPMLAIEKYIKNLIKLQSSKAKELMPREIIEQLKIT